FVRHRDRVDTNAVNTGILTAEIGQKSGQILIVTNSGAARYQRSGNAKWRPYAIRTLGDRRWPKRQTIRITSPELRRIVRARAAQRTVVALHPCRWAPH